MAASERSGGVLGLGALNSFFLAALVGIRRRRLQRRRRRRCWLQRQQGGSGGTVVVAAAPSLHVSSVMHGDGNCCDTNWS
eukprot:3917740-Pleurochrysis_carterae.AAC.2